MMDKKEVIVLSSDDETDTQQFEKNKPVVTIQPTSSKIFRVSRACASDVQTSRLNPAKRKLSIDPNYEKKIALIPKLCKCNDVSKRTPEFVDLVDCTDKSANESDPIQQDRGTDRETVQSVNQVDIIDIDEEDESSNCPPEPAPCEQSQREAKKSQLTSDVNAAKVEKNSEKVEEGQENTDKDERINENLKFFTEFVEYCGSLEISPSDRAKLTRKLMRAYGEAESSYVKTEEFKTFIRMCREKVSSENLYLVAGRIADDLTLRKNIEVIPAEPVGNEMEEKPKRRMEGSNECGENFEVTEETTEKLNKKRTKYINKIIEKLNNLGNKIKELEEEEVDLSDEEDSSYILLQRYRERFCQIYNRLCAYTNAIPDANRNSARRICFSGSKYPAINRCIEVWLNKTKSFPDFTDIMKLLESQGPSLGLPSNKESLRMIAIEIFQEVGTMLQRRRRYDLWDSFSAFLDDQIDPAEGNPALQQILLKNFENRIKKEQEIFQYYTEMQERERLEPEEVPEEEANRSPTESGNEDEKEIEKIENDIHKGLDVDVTEDFNENGSSEKDNGSDESKMGEGSKSDSSVQKESKNNFKNCKSLKWRSENAGKWKGDPAGSSVGAGNEERERENEANEGEESSNSKESCGKSNGGDKSDSDLELLTVEEDVSSRRVLGGAGCETPDPGKKTPTGRKDCASGTKSLPKQFQMDERTENRKSNGPFDVHFCQIVADNVFEDVGKKGRSWGKRKVFRDLTNVSRLMETNGKSRRLSELFSPSFFHRSFREFEKSSWKRKFRVSYRLSGSREQKCALSQGEKTGKSVNSGAGGKSQEKEGQQNSEGGGDERDGFYGGQGGESHEDGDGDKNSKNGGTEDDVGESKPEEEEEEEEDKDENGTECFVESGEHSEASEKAEETQEETKAPLEEESGNSVYETVDLLSSNSSEECSKGGNEEKGKGNKDQAERVEKEEGNEDQELTETEESEYQQLTETEEETEDHEETERELEKEDEKEVEKEKRNDDQRETEKGNKEMIERENDDDDETRRERINERKEEGSEGLKETKNERTVEQEQVNKKQIMEVEEKCKKIEETSGEGLPWKLEEYQEKTDWKTEESIPGIGTCEEILIDEQITSTIVPKRREKFLSLNTWNTDIFLGKVPGEAEDERKPVYARKQNGSVKAKRTLSDKISCGTESPWKPTLSQFLSPKLNRKSVEDEERVKRFLLHSPSSISITPPRSLLSKPPSQAALQALATLRNLKGISTTLVKGKPKNEDDVTVIGGSFNKPEEQKGSNATKRRRTDLPVISSVQSMYSAPEIITVQGNSPGFEASSSYCHQRPDCETSSIRISNVWGNLPNNFMQIVPDESLTPGCSGHNTQQSNPLPLGVLKKKTAKKKVEYVVLD